MLIYLCETKPKAMNLEITSSERFSLIDGINARIIMVEKLILSFNSMVLVTEYVKERDQLIKLKTKLLSI